MRYFSFYAMRHGETNWNVQERFQGHSDVALSPTGRLQAEENGRRLKGHLDSLGIVPSALHCLSSPLMRATETFALVAQELGIPAGQVNTDDRLRELSFGRWEGMTSAEIKARFPEERRRRKQDWWNFAPAGGTSLAELFASMADFLTGLPQERPSLIVTHSGNLRAILALRAGYSVEEARAATLRHDTILSWGPSGLLWI